MRKSNPDKEIVDLPNLLEHGEQALQQSDLSGAQECFEKALEYLGDQGSAESPEGALCLQNLGEIYFRTGKYQSSISAYQHLVQLGEMALGPYHAEVVAATYRLAKAYEAANMPSEAEQAYKRSASSAERTLGVAHPIAQSIREAYFAFLAKKSSAEEIVIPESFGKAPIRNEPIDQAADSESAGFMPPPPPPQANQSKSRLREMERDDSAISGETQQQQTSKFGVDFSLLAENTGASKAIKSLGQLYKTPKKIKNLRYGAESTEEEVEKSLAVKDILRRWQVIASMIVAVIAIGIFGFILFDKIGSVNAVALEDAVTRLLRTNKSFQSIDGVTGLEFADDGPYVTLQHDVKHRRIPYVILKGGLSDIAVMITSAFTHREVWYQSKERCLIADNGVQLFAKNSPDLEISTAMNNFKDFLQDYYRTERTYPSSDKRYRENPKVQYDNPYAPPHSAKAFPALMTLDVKTEEMEFLFPGLTNAKSPTAILEFLRHGGEWQYKNMMDHRPGRICAVGLRQGIEKVGDNYLTTEIYVLAYDSANGFISGGLPGITYVIGLADGKVISDQEADRRIDVEQSSVHPPDRICIVRGEEENVALMRQALPITLSLALIGSFFAFLFLEFRNRKAEPKRMPQVFETIGASCLFLLIIIGIIRILPW
jgi:tetratricopeptide (TPR) repeat protein